MALAGTFLAGIILARSSLPIDSGRASRELNVAEAITTAGNAVAAAMSFTLPSLWILANVLHNKDVAAISFATVLRVATAAAGGISFGVLLTVVLVPRLAEHAATEQKPPEAEAVKALILDVSRRLSVRDPLAAGLVIACAFFGLVAGTVSRLEVNSVCHQHFFELGLPPWFSLDAKSVVLGFDPFYVALGALIGLSTARLVFAGGVLGLGYSALGGFAAAHTLKISDQLKFLGAIVLVAASLQKFVEFLREGTAKPDEVESERSRRVGDHPRLSRLFLLGSTLMSGVALVVVWMGVFAANGAASATMLVAIGVVVALVGCILAERVVFVAGVSLNPTSALSLLMAAIAIPLLSSRGLSSIIPLCAFVVGAGSIAGGLAQDLLVGRDLGTSRGRQATGKWLGSMLAIALAVPVFHWLFVHSPGLPASLELPMSQASAIAALLDSQNHLLLADLVKGAILVFVGLVALRVEPIATAIGITLPLKTSSALLLGALVGWQIAERFLKEKKDATQERVENVAGKAVLWAGMAATLGAWAIGATLAGLVASPPSADTRHVACDWSWSWWTIPALIITAAMMGTWWYVAARDARLRRDSSSMNR